jgi:tight adherence protein B
VIYALGLVAAVGVFLLYLALTASPPVSGPDSEYGFGFEPEAVAPPPTPAAPPRSARERILLPLSAVARPLLSASRGDKLQHELNRAGLTLKAQEFLTMQLGTGLLVGLLAYLRFGNVILGLVGIAVGFYLPNLYVRRRQRQRRNAFEQQLGDTIALISNGVKAGYSIQQALQGVVEGGRPPLSDEISRVVRETSLGIQLDTALEHVNDRIQSKSFDLMVTAILIHRTVGGNLAEVLDKINETIRQRVQVAGEVRVLTAQARASGYIITGLPFAVGAILSIISPSFERPLFTNPIGWGMIALGLVMIGIGYAIIRRITDIRL